MEDDGLQFRFEFTLPRDIPSSYEGKLGNIQYSIKAVIKEQDSAVFKLDPTGFNVKAEVTLNSQDYVKFQKYPKSLHVFKWYNSLIGIRIW